MKTILLTALTFTGIALCAPEAQARDHRYYRSDCGPSRYVRPTYSYYRSDCAPRVYYSRSYDYSPRYYYRPSSRSSYVERCEPERRRSPLLSFLFRF